MGSCSEDEMSDDKETDQMSQQKHSRSVSAKSGVSGISTAARKHCGHLKA